MKLAVVGKDVSKSVSPQIHNFIAKKFNKQISYDTLSIAEDKFETEIDSVIAAYEGINVTIPYKLAVIPHLDKTEGDAKIFGAVNTVNAKTRTGSNTDGLGFMLMLKNSGVEVCGKSILLIGAGGAGRSVAKKLCDSGASVYVYDKNAANAKAVAAEFAGVTAIETVPLTPYYAVINASGVGMHKTVGVSPVGAEVLKNCEAAIDLIYNPPQSEFLRIAASLGKKTVNGLAMLFYQAYFAQCIWFEKSPNELQAKEFFEEFLKENK